MRWSSKRWVVILGLFFLISFLLVDLAQVQVAAADNSAIEDWQKDWGLPAGFALEIDTEGYHLPSSLAFVRNPGDKPDDPLYYVTELRGTIKVVTNNHEVHIFASDFLKKTTVRSLDDIPDEFGVTGICLEPNNGYIFATVTHETENGRFNDIIRFRSIPVKFGLDFTEVISVGQVFDGFKTGFSHVVGPCYTQDDVLFVGVGDGYSNASDLPLGLDIPAGKILRMSFAGKPVQDNPFYDGKEITPGDYVWAYGFRNPFGLYVVDDKVFVGDNGDGMDRFVLAKKGEDYLWNGNDLSIGAKNLFAFSPTIAPTQIDLYSNDNDFFPGKYKHTFFMGMAGNTFSGIMNIPYVDENNDQESVPEIFLNYLNTKNNHYAGSVAALSLGPDGLYFAPIALDYTDEMAVYKISYNPTNEHPFRQNEYIAPEKIINSKNCLACHKIIGRGSEFAPELTPRLLQSRLMERLNSQTYLDLLDQIDAMDHEITSQFANERQYLREVNGKERVWYWVYYRLLEPRFDNPEAAMPTLGLSEVQAASLADYFVGDLDEITTQESMDTAAADEITDRSLTNRLLEWREKLPPVGYRDLALVFVLGGIVGGILMWKVRRIKIGKDK